MTKPLNRPKQPEPEKALAAMLFDFVVTRISTADGIDAEETVMALWIMFSRHLVFKGRGRWELIGWIASDDGGVGSAQAQAKKV